MAVSKVVQSTNQQAALRYARAGYSVLLVWPLRNGKCTCGTACGSNAGKHPINKAWQRALGTDDDKIRAAFDKHPDAHIGIIPPEGHCIVDVDPRNGGDETIKALKGDNAWPETVTQKSGGGGWHLIFKGEPSGGLGAGLDVKKAGRGFVVAWPSAHASGGSYVWKKGCAPWDVEPAELPKWLKRKKTSEDDKVDVEVPNIEISKLREALAFIDAEEYGRWINIGQALKHAYGDAGRAVWEQWSQTSSKWQQSDDDKWDTFDQNRDRPLLTLRTVMRIARQSGYRPLATEFANSLWAQGDVTDLLTTKPPALDWVFHPCIPAGKVTLLSGAGGSSKSFFAITLAMHLAVGMEFANFKPHRAAKSLLLVAEESKDDIHRRLHAVTQSRLFSAGQIETIGKNLGVVSIRGLDWRLVDHDEAGNVQDTERVDYIIEQCSAVEGLRLIVLDPLVVFNGVSENDNMEMARLMFALDRIAKETGAAVLVVHHMSKMGQVTSLTDATQSIVRGASAIVDNARSAMLMLKMPRGDAPLYNIQEEDASRFIVVRVAKNNYGPSADDMVLAIEQGGGLRHAPEVKRVHKSVAQATNNRGNVETQHKLLRALHSTPNASQHALALACEVNQTTVRRHLQALALRELVLMAGVGQAVRYTVTAQGRTAAGIENQLEGIE